MCRVGYNTLFKQEPHSSSDSVLTVEGIWKTHFTYAYVNRQQSWATWSHNKQSCLRHYELPNAHLFTKFLDKKISPFFGNFSPCCQAVIGQLFVYVPMNFSYTFWHSSWCLW